MDEGHDERQASADFKFAAAVAEFGMQLRDSPHRGKLSLAGVLELASGTMGEDPQQPLPARKPGRPPGSTSKGNGAVTLADGRNEAKALRQASGRGQELDELEVEIDRLMTRVMTMEDLPEVEGALRQARRLLVLANQG